MMTEDCFVGEFHFPTPTCYHIEKARNERLQRQVDAALATAHKWAKIAETHGPRQFTGNDHLLFANELTAALHGAGARGGEDGDGEI